MVGLDRHRFEIPLYTVGAAARIVDVHPSTLSTWTRSYRRDGANGGSTVTDPIITRLSPERPRYPCIPFVGLAEALVLAAVRRSGVPMQRIRPALKVLEQEIGLRHALIPNGCRRWATRGGWHSLRMSRLDAINWSGRRWLHPASASFAFLLRQDLKAEEMAARFLRNLRQIVRACHQAGPLIYAVHESRIEKIQIKIPQGEEPAGS